ncbi:hypothetical protein TH59_09425 [Pantoea ananatis]|nr:hypothetical protein [Pantoea ananatis]KNA29868.1 hypothetical protein ACO03_13355 [Pantoea ananatis]MDC7865425.1 hypothetical protein [Pantoea ananatis]MDN4153494.1 hypothetical protein [Pantoea ananatis]PQK98633.1 hypothetical protein CG434_15915 [Pantoea ananatis]PWK08193.1 hypothetical protein C7421_106238 [Pantoea ananatis]
MKSLLTHPKMSDANINALMSSLLLTQLLKFPLRYLFNFKPLQKIAEMLIYHYAASAERELTHRNKKD